MAEPTSVRDRMLSARLPSAVDRVIGRIRDLLLARVLKPGDRLPSEGELVELLGVSRGSIREAMKILSGFGVVTIRAGDGTYVAREMQGGLLDPLLFQMLLSNPDRQALRELRQLLEMGTVPLLVEHATEADLHGLASALQRTRQLVAEACVDPEQLTDADMAFHQALGRATHNPLVERVYNTVMDFLRPTIRDTYVRNRTGESALAVHEAILTALERRDLAPLQAAVAHSIESWEDSR